MQLGGVGAQRAQLRLDVLDVIGGFARRPGYRQRLVAVGVKVLSDRGIGVLPGLGGSTLPAIEDRQGTQLTGGLQGGLAACIGRVEHLPCRFGAPPVNIGHRQRHGSGRTRYAASARLNGLQHLSVPAVHRREVNPVVGQIQRMTADPGDQPARVLQPGRRLRTQRHSRAAYPAGLCGHYAVVR